MSRSTETVSDDGTVTQVWNGLTWDAIGQNPVMQAQWEKLGYSIEGVADIVTQPFDYTIDTVGILITGRGDLRILLHGGDAVAEGIPPGHRRKI